MVISDLVIKEPRFRLFGKSLIQMKTNKRSNFAAVSQVVKEHLTGQVEPRWDIKLFFFIIITIFKLILANYKNRATRW